MDSEDLPTADKAIETLAQSQDTLLADEDDSEVLQVQQKSVVDVEDEPTLIREGAEKLESTKSSEEEAVEPHALVGDANQETNTTTPTAHEPATSAPESHVEQVGDSDIDNDTNLPEAAIATGLAGAGALGLAKTVSDYDDEDQSLVKESSDNADVDEAPASKNPEARWAPSKDDSSDLVEPVQETDTDEKQEPLSTASLEEGHAVETKKDDGFWARAVVPEAALTESLSSEEIESEKTHARETSTGEAKSEQTLPAHDDNAAKDIDKTVNAAEPPTLDEVEAQEDKIEVADGLSEDQYTVPAQETETPANGFATKEHAEIGTDLPTTKEILTEEADIVFPKTTVEELPVVQDHDSADETVNEVVNEKENLVSEEALGEEGTPHFPFIIHPMDLEIDKSC